MGSLSATWFIALNTMREAIRDRILIGVLGFSSIVILFSRALAEISLNQELRVLTDIGLATMSLSSVLVAIVLGASLLYKEIERKTLYMILPKSISRGQFLIGKFLGITLTGGVFLILTFALLLWLLYVQEKGFDGLSLALLAAALVGAAGLRWRGRSLAYLYAWSLLTCVFAAGSCVSAGTDVTPLAVAVSLFWLELLLLAAVAMLFSSFSTPFLTGLFTLGVWLLGRNADVLVTMKSKMLSEPVKQLVQVVGQLIPNFYLFSPGVPALARYEIAAGGAVGYLIGCAGYAAAYATALVALAALIFQRRDLT